MLRRQEEKVYRRAAAARATIGHPPHDYSGEAYERDVFSVIRSIFFYTEYWAGPNKPDGFCSLVYFDDGSLRKPVKFNWSYDAKFTQTAAGYV